MTALVSPTVTCYALLVAFLVLERRFREGSEAKALELTAADRGTTPALGIAFLTGLVLVVSAPLWSHLGWGRWGSLTLAWAGVATMVVGIGLRFWASQVLGAAYTRTLKTLPGQAVISRGPYRVLRHPGYAGVLLMWVGAGLALRNWLVLACLCLVFGWAYGRRMNVEEEMLLASLGEAYRDYRGNTWRIIPFVY